MAAYSDAVMTRFFGLSLKQTTMTASVAAVITDNAARKSGLHFALFVFFIKYPRSIPQPLQVAGGMRGSSFQLTNVSPF